MIARRSREAWRPACRCDRLRAASGERHRPSAASCRRNGGQRRYRAAAADKRAWDRALRPKLCKLARHEELRQLVAARLSENWSPEQIAGWLKHTYPDDEAHQVSHETIYRSLFVQARGVLKKDLQAHLRSGRAIRRSRHASSKSDAARQPYRHDLDPRASGVGRGSRGAGSLGRRPPVRLVEQLHRHAGRATLALRASGQGRRTATASR